MERIRSWRGWMISALLLHIGPVLAEPGQWLERGLPLVEYPGCYQLWVCAGNGVAAAEADHQMPKGTWGTCDNMMRGAEAGCGKCLAPSPDEPCDL